MTTTSTARRARARALDTRPAVSYARISKRKSGDGGGATIKIERQHEENSDYLRELFDDVHVEQYDDNMSAWDPDKRRPGWNRLLDDVRSGKYRAVVAWHADRFTRQPLELELLLDACRRADTELHTVRGGHVTDRLSMRIEGSLAARESDGKSDRIKARFDTLACEGKFLGGRRRYGYTSDMSEIVEHEAAVIREAAARVIRGDSLKSIAADFNARGIKTAGGAQWRGPNMSTLLAAPRLAGLRVHLGEIVADAAWPSILDRATHEQVVAILKNPARRNPGTNARKHLLTGLAKCAVCGDGVRRQRARTRGAQRKLDYYGYTCETSFHVFRAQHLVDEYVVGAILGRLERRDAVELFVDDTAAEDAARLRAQIAVLDDSEAELAVELATRQVTARAYAKATTAIDNERARLRDELNTIIASNARPKAALEDFTRDNVDVEALWEAADLSHKRAIIDALCTIRINKAPGRGAQFDEEQAVTIEWKGGA